MFVQIIQGHVTDPVEVHEQFDSWRRDLAPGADGWLGTTAGVTPDGTLLALVRFESAEAAMRNSHRPEQHQWWMETSKLFAGDITFHNSTRADPYLGGGSDDAGFVQVMQGYSRDPERFYEINREVEPLLREYRPDVLGGVTMLHDDGEGDITDAVYFTTEAEAREAERRPWPDEFRDLWREIESIYTDVRYYDLSDPWLYSPGEYS